MTQNFNISFIIIGRNEGWKLQKCFQSVYKTIEYYNLEHPDVIYVDSKSIDNSIEIARSFSIIRIFEITGECNAAIARNIGAKEAKGEILFFIDGDMEIELSFLSYVQRNKHELNDYCLTGHLDDYFYTGEDNLIEIKNRTYKRTIPSNKQVLQVTGGIFLINKENWNKVDGMKTKYRRSQDLDFFLRLSKKGIKILRLPSLIAMHHTIDYRNEKRMWTDLMKGDILFDSLIFRDHLFSAASWKRIIRSKYTSILLLISIFILRVNYAVFLYAILGYGWVLAIRVFKNTLNTSTDEAKLIYVQKRWIYQLVTDIMFWIGFILFWPKKKSVHYINNINT